MVAKGQGMEIILQIQAIDENSKQGHTDESKLFLHRKIDRACAVQAAGKHAGGETGKAIAGPCHKRQGGPWRKMGPCRWDIGGI